MLSWTTSTNTRVMPGMALSLSVCIAQNLALVHKTVLRLTLLLYGQSSELKMHKFNFGVK